MVTYQTERQHWKTREIANCFDLDVYQARYYLLHLCEEGRVMKAGTGRGAPLYWSLNNSPPTAGTKTLLLRCFFQLS